MKPKDLHPAYVSTYLNQLDYPRPSTTSALLVYAPDLREAAPLLARLTGHGCADVVEYLTRADARLSELLDQNPAGASVTSQLERVLIGAELRATKQPYTRRLLHRVKAPPSTCRVALVASAFNDAARRDMRKALWQTEQACGVLVVRDECPADMAGLQPYFEEVALHFTTLAAHLIAGPLDLHQGAWLANVGAEV